jgi:hypothetical protein
MGVACCLGDCYVQTALAVAALYFFCKWLFAPNYRRPVTRPVRDPLKRKQRRGTGAEFESVHRGTGEVLGTVRAYTPQDVKNAEQAARVAATEGPNAWCRTSFEERRAVLQEISDWIVAHQEEIIELSVRDSGKTGKDRTVCFWRASACCMFTDDKLVFVLLRLFSSYGSLYG